MTRSRAKPANRPRDKPEVQSQAKTTNNGSAEKPRLARKPAPREHITRLKAIDRALLGIFLLAAIFYVWTAATSQTLTLNGGAIDRYNLLASAFLHFHLSIGEAPAQLLSLKNPYSPSENIPFLHAATDASTIGDDVLYNGHLYFVWGPAPALVLLVPLHLLGLEPSASFTVAFFAIVGLGFALATLRVLIRKIGIETLWICALAGLALSFSSVVPFLLRNPTVTEDTISGGLCFVMAGVWLAVSAIADGRASLRRVALMSLCFGLAAASRPALGLTALVLVPVYMTLRSSQEKRRLLLGLIGPVAGCGVLLLAYNQARFGHPFEFGARHQLTGYDSPTAPLDHLGYVFPGAWPYVASLPRLSVVFPFIVLTAPALKSTAGLAAPEMTGGLLPMAPIVLFGAALPWIWRRGPSQLRPLALALMVLAGIGIVIMLLPAYQFFAPTERYEAEFATLLVLGGLAGWFVLSTRLRGRWRQLARVGGGILVAWGCLAGWASSFVGYTNVLAIKHPGTWATLEEVGSPLSALIANVAGHPLMASVSANNLGPVQPVRYTGLENGPASFSLAAGEPAHFSVVSPGQQKAVLRGYMAQRHDEEPGYPPVTVNLTGPGGSSHDYTLPAKPGQVQIPIELELGVNHFELSPQSTTGAVGGGQVLLVEGLSVASGK